MSRWKYSRLIQAAGSRASYIFCPLFDPRGSPLRVTTHTRAWHHSVALQHAKMGAPGSRGTDGTEMRGWQFRSTMSSISGAPQLLALGRHLADPYSSGESQQTPFCVHGASRSLKPCMCGSALVMGVRMHMPEAVFGANALVLTHRASGFRLTFDAEGALREWARDSVIMESSTRVAPAELPVWRERMHAAKLRTTTAVDWTFCCADYAGDREEKASGEATSAPPPPAAAVVGGPLVGLLTSARPSPVPSGQSCDGDAKEGATATPTAWRPHCGPGIDMALLRRRDEIIWSADLPLYEDHLHDNGVSELRVRIRVMPTCFFVLMRHTLRIDGVLVQQREVRGSHGALGRALHERHGRARALDVCLHDRLRAPRLLLTQGRPSNTSVASCAARVKSAATPTCTLFCRRPHRMGRAVIHRDDTAPTALRAPPCAMWLPIRLCAAKTAACGRERGAVPHCSPCTLLGVPMPGCHARLHRCESSISLGAIKSYARGGWLARCCRPCLRRRSVALGRSATLVARRCVLHQWTSNRSPRLCRCCQPRNPLRKPSSTRRRQPWMTTCVRSPARPVRRLRSPTLSLPDGSHPPPCQLRRCQPRRCQLEGCHPPPCQLRRCQPRRSQR